MTRGKRPATPRYDRMPWGGTDLALTRRADIRRVARTHGVDSIRWWPPRRADFVIGELPQSLGELRADLERVLGCRVAIYLAEHQPEEVRRRLTEQTIDLNDGSSGEPGPEEAGG